jgi:NADH dehydrogenase
VRYVDRQLQQLGVEVRLRTRVTEVMPRHVVLESGTRLSVGPVVSTRGQRPVVLPGTEFLTRAGDGRIRTDDALRVLGFDRIWAGGDAAAVPHRLSGLPCPANALWAIKHGRRIGGNLARALVGRQPRRFTYRGLGQLAALGVGKGVGHVYRVPLTGWTAWLLRIAFFVRFMPSREQAHEVLSDLTARSWPLSRRRGNPLQAGSSGGSHRKRGRR